MERIEKTPEGSYTVGITHWELLTLHAVLTDWLNDHGGAVHQAETRLERELFEVIDPHQKDSYEDEDEKFNRPEKGRGMPWQ